MIGRRVTVRLNGRNSDVDLNDIMIRRFCRSIRGSCVSGHIGFLGHNDEVYFRNIRIKLVAKVQLNNKHPEGFELLFDAATLANWQGLLAKPNNDPTKRAALAADERVLRTSSGSEDARPLARGRWRAAFWLERATA